MRLLAGLSAFALVVGAVPGARAEHVRAHGSLGVAKAVGEWQGSELGFGAGLFGAIEMPLAPQLGAELEIGTLMLTEADDPRDVALKPQDAAHSIYGAVGLNFRPFADDDPSFITDTTGIWASTNVGATTTGGLFRAVWDVHAGYDFLLEQGRYGIGPMVSLVHVFQSDDELRPEDANVLVVGGHFVFDSAPRVPRDRDGDGILDRVDQCPDVPEDKDGFEDTDGCPEKDNDKDGILDLSDHCPLDPEDKDGFEDTDGCPEKDNDKDGLLDPVDKCPNEPEDVDGFEDEDGCPDTDNDKDGILDKEDLCPNEAEVVNGYADTDGCPDEEQVRVVGDKIVLDDRVHFEQNNAIIRPVSYPLLERLARVIISQPSYSHIEVQGHTDQKGTDEYNNKLSADRAKAVVEFLVRQNVARGRLSSVGFGSKRLLVEKTNPRALYLNRRVEFVITREGQPAPAPSAPAAPAPTPGDEATPAPTPDDPASAAPAPAAPAPAAPAPAAPAPAAPAPAKPAPAPPPAKPAPAPAPTPTAPVPAPAPGTPGPATFPKPAG